MTPENFTYWLKGFFEMTDAETLSKEQTKMIKEHLDLVHRKETLPLFTPNEKINPGPNPLMPPYDLIC